jgi:LacI family transcriptional regulator
MGEKAGQLAARALAAHPGAGERIVLEPLDVVARRSTDVTVVHDPIVERARGWSAQRSRDRLTLNAIARAASCSRQRLEQRFRAAIGRTVMQEVRRARVDIAKRLLSTTSLPLEQVAEQSGFTSATMLSVVFRRETGTPPGGYRRRFRGKDSRDE